MTDTFDQTLRTLRIECSIPETDVVVTAFTGTDRVSEPYLFMVTLTTSAEDPQVVALMGEKVTVWLDNLSQDDRRPVHGRVRRLSGPSLHIRGYKTWRAEIVPQLNFLDYSADIRIFQSLSVPDILKKVFQERGLADYELRGLMGTYPTLDYCIQYRETAFNFVSRLMEHVGLFYWHEHEGGKHTLVIADYNKVCKPALALPAVQSTGSQFADVGNLAMDYNVRSGKWTQTDYDFTSPSTNLRTQDPIMIQSPNMLDYEVYEYPGQYTKKSDGDPLTRVRIEHEEARFQRLNGDGFRALLDAGRQLTIDPGNSQPPADTDTYLLVEVTHDAIDPLSASGSSGSARYSNQFVGVPMGNPFRPDRTARKPFVQGVQTAVVTGPAGEKIYTDQYGRVKVKFFWDRNPDGNADENSSCWLRVSQSWADDKFGSIHLPRIGEEVIVDFLEGDPDRPIITGRVYNGAKMPPYTLPDNKTQSGFKSRSVPAPGSNEFRFEDKAGSEEVYLHAEKDLNIVVKNNESDKIGNNRTVDVKVDDTRTVGGNLKDTVTGTDTRKVDGDFTEILGANVVENVTGNVNIFVGGNVAETITGNHNHYVTGSITEVVTGTLSQTVTAGITVFTPATMNLTALGGYNLTAPPSTTTAAVANAMIGANNALYGINNAISGMNNAIYGVQVQAVGANAQLSALSSTLIGVQKDSTALNLTAGANDVQTVTNIVLVVALITIL